MSQASVTPTEGMRSPPWSRLLAFAVSIAALFLIIRKVDGTVLLQTLHQSEGRWWFLGLALFGLGLVLQAWRWHQMLIVVGEAVSFRMSVIYTFIGHCFSALLFGALVSDIMKAGLYSRRRGCPTTTVLVASALDRFYGGISTALYAAMTVWIGLQHGLRLSSHRGEWKWKAGPLFWAALGLALLALCGVAYRWRARWWSPWIRARQQWGRGFGTLRSRPFLSVLLILAGVGVQVCISSVLALSLRAVLPAANQVPWIEMLWTFPAIGVVASLPITISGAGARDAAALWIWGLFGVSGAHCLGATLLTLTVNLAWALTGGLLLWVAAPSAQPPPSKGSPSAI